MSSDFDFTKKQPLAHQQAPGFEPDGKALNAVAHRMADDPCCPLATRFTAHGAGPHDCPLHGFEGKPNTPQEEIVALAAIIGYLTPEAQVLFWEFIKKFKAPEEPKSRLVI